ncbi:helix-turn-helix domain-containing protein [Emticicia sp. CRIBPO]|uniref:helix-turn-helix domain-containing protein n=1 Tax=Emticicia sp. CRIBPO TaxID=2683258 RepID=UPI00141236CF|nr:helix-turn-helix transcriptional regulator [Emticicia sp. CRIBPO]NBA88909.1 helix-turn-helix domain-containing protein [Emticicia sp. CRIBPO]
MQSKTKPSRIHEGRNIKRFREMLGIKQEALAFELGDEWNQKKVSILEQRETVDDRVMKQVADVLKIPVEAFRNFDEEQAINFISNTASFENCQQPAFFNNQPTFNPLDKLIEAFEEIKRLNAEVIKVKDEQIALLERMLGGR